VFGQQQRSFIKNLAQSGCRDRKMMVSAFVICERWFLEGTPLAAQGLSGGTAILLRRFISSKIADRETVIPALSFILDQHMWLDIFFVHHPGQHRCGSISGIADQAIRLDIGVFFDPLNHRVGAHDLGCSMSRGSVF
jgi:hypothetical protein